MSLLNEYKNNLDEKIQKLKKLINKNMCFNKLKTLRNTLLINILQFFNSSDLTGIIFMNKFMKNKILSIFTEYGKHIKKNFENKFSDFFLLKKSFISLKQISNKRRLINLININLIIQFQINDTSLKNKSLILGYFSNFFGEIENMKNFFLFDIRPNGPLSYWIMREYTSVNFFNF